MSSDQPTPANCDDIPAGVHNPMPRTALESLEQLVEQTRQQDDSGETPIQKELRLQSIADATTRLLPSKKMPAHFANQTTPITPAPFKKPQPNPHTPLPPVAPAQPITDKHQPVQRPVEQNAILLSDFIVRNPDCIEMLYEAVRHHKHKYKAFPTVIFFSRYMFEHVSRMFRAWFSPTPFLGEIYYPMGPNRTQTIAIRTEDQLPHYLKSQLKGPMPCNAVICLTLN